MCKNTTLQEAIEDDFLILLNDKMSVSLLDMSSDRGSDNGSEMDEERRITTDEVLNELGCGAFQVIAYLLSGVTFIAYAFVIMTFPLVNVSVTHAFSITSVTYAALPALSFLGNSIGSVLFGFLSDSFGRVWPYAAFMALTGTFVLASAFAPNLPVLILLRAIGGIGVGGIQSQVYPTLIEFLPIRNRGRTSVLIMINQAIGSAISVGLSWWLITTYHTNGWRYFIAATAIPSFIAAIFRLAFYFESPRFLLGKGRLPAVLNIFKLIARINCKELNITSPAEIAHGRAKKKEGIIVQLAKFKELFKPPLLRYTILLAIIQPGVRQAYISSAIYFPLILENLGVNSFLIILFGSLSQIPGFLLMSIITEWPYFGRLNTMRLYIFLTIVFYLLFAFIRNNITTAVFAVIIYFLMNPIISIVYTYVSEIYPTEIRGIASGFMNTVQGVVGIAMPFLSGLLTDLSATRPWVFPVGWAVVYVVLLLVSFGLRRETRGKDLIDLVKGIRLTHSSSAEKETDHP